MPDSKKTSVKVSVFDAFRSGPRTIKTKKPSPAGDQTAEPTVEPGPAAPPEAAAPVEATTDPPVKSGDKADQPTETTEVVPKGTEWSDEDNLKLLQFKDVDGNTWKEITIKLEKFSQNDVKKQYQQLKRKGGEGTGGDGASKMPGEFIEVIDLQDDGGEDLDLNIDPGPEVEVSAASRAATFANDDWTPEEVSLLERLNEVYEHNKWLCIASQFYDRTGLRVNPEAIRQKLS
ncbi:MAG: hypothetical protein M1837_006482 [Sclerophora amabilis]|nr:MAG: hypothetical protein M1837_006482 [Sclerophora amabilis]